MKTLLATMRLTSPADDAERGDVPGWVLITMMTAALVVMLWGVAGGTLTEMFTNAIRSVSFAQ